MNLWIVLASYYLKFLVKGKSRLSSSSLLHFDNLLVLELILIVTLAVMTKLLLQTCFLRKSISQAIRLAAGCMCSFEFFKSS